MSLILPPKLSALGSFKLYPYSHLLLLFLIILGMLFSEYFHIKKITFIVENLAF